MIRPAISNSNAITPIPMPNTTLIHVLRLRFSFFALMLSIIKRIIEVHSSIHVINYFLSSLSSELVSLLYLQSYVSIHLLLCQDLILYIIQIKNGRYQFRPSLKQSGSQSHLTDVFGYSVIDIRNNIIKRTVPREIRCQLFHYESRDNFIIIIISRY